MHRNSFILFAVCISLFTSGFSKEVSIATESPSKFSHHEEQSSTEKPQPLSMQSDAKNSGNKYSVKGHPEIANSDRQASVIQLNNKHHTEVQHHADRDHSDQQVQHSNQEVQHPDQQVQHPDQQVQHEQQHSENVHQDVHHADVKNTKHQISTSRQFHPPPYHQPMLFQPPSGFEAIRRQFGGGIGSDLVMMGLITLPILGLLTMGSASLGNIFGLGASSSSSKKSSSKRNKRSLKEKAADAVEYAKNLWNVMEQLEKAFEKYDLYQAECRLRVVCEAHHKDRRMGSWGQSILDLMRQQKELEGRELLPVSRFLFSNYAEAAQAGVRNENCAQLYTGCPRHLSYYLSAKEDQLENEVENF